MNVPNLAQSEYKRQHDNVAKAIHWGLCKQVNIECGEKWYKHSPEPVVENENAKIIILGLWLPCNRPDIVVVDKKKRVCQRIDVACPGDSRILLKEEEKNNAVFDLERAIAGLAQFDRRWPPNICLVGHFDTANICSY